MKAAIVGIARGEIFEPEFSESFNAEVVIAKLCDILGNDKIRWVQRAYDVLEPIDVSVAMLLEVSEEPEDFIKLLASAKRVVEKGCGAATIAGTEAVVMFYDENVLSDERAGKALTLIAAGNRDDAFTRKVGV